MTKLTVVYLRGTGHVLAAVTRAAGPAADEKVAALAGSALPVRAIGGTKPVAVTFPAGRLVAATIDDDLDVVLNPHVYQVVETLKDGKPVPKVTRAAVEDLSVALSTSGATISASGSLPADVDVILVLTRGGSNPPPPVFLTGKTAGDMAKRVSLSQELTSKNTWDTLALVRGLTPVAQPKVDVP